LISAGERPRLRDPHQTLRGLRHSGLRGRWPTTAGDSLAGAGTSRALAVGRTARRRWPTSSKWPSPAPTG